MMLSNIIAGSPNTQEKNKRNIYMGSRAILFLVGPTTIIYFIEIKECNICLRIWGKMAKINVGKTFRNMGKKRKHL